MPSFVTRNFIPDDLPQITALQQAYHQVYPQAPVIPGEVYLSAGFADGKNIFCTFDESGLLMGYAPIFPVLTEDPGFPHTVWTEVKVNPKLAEPRPVKDLLFERVKCRSAEITRAFPGHLTRLTFQYYPSEQASIEYVLSRGCAYSESVFRLMNDLSQAVALVPPPGKILIREWRMESEAEQLAYVQARNEAFPEAPVTLADWQHFLSSPAWQEGTTISAFDGQEVVGSVAVFWDESAEQQSGRKAGLTEYIFVRPGWRRRGIAPYLIGRALLYLKAHGRDAAYLEVKAVNQTALELYYRLGYQLIEESRLYVLDLSKDGKIE